MTFLEMKQPLVSIIIPCYNVEQYLDRCITSVITQTLKEIEIILVDDNSPDRVPEMCDEWAKKDQRIKVIHKKNEGLGMACNSGLAIATGKYIAFLDSDDWVDSTMYQTMYETAEKYQAQMVFTGLRRVDVYGNILGFLHHKDGLMVYKNKEEIDQLACDMIASDPSVMAERTLQMSAKVILYYRKTIEDNHLFFISERQIMSEDLHFNLNMLCHSKCVCVLPLFFYNYQYTTGSISQHVDFEKFEKIKSLYYYLVEECKQLGISGNVDQRIQRLFIGYVRDYMRNICRAQLSLNKKKKIIAKIVHDSIWKFIWGNYPVQLVPFKHRLYIRLVQKKCIILLITLLKYM